MTTSLESVKLLERAAELRAAGIRWTDTAAQLAVGVEELRQLASEHTRDYERLVRRARTAVLHETLAAALAALRAHLSSPDPRVSFLAATTIVRYELARLRHDAKSAGAKMERMLNCKKRPIPAREVRNQNASETPEVQNRQEVSSAKNVVRPQVHSAPSQPAPKQPPAPARAAYGPAPSAYTRCSDEALLLEAIAREREAILKGMTPQWRADASGGTGQGDGQRHGPHSNP